MLTYITRRVLLMIPTLFGITFAVWLVMALSPGRPGEASKMGQQEEDITKDAGKALRENESQRIFRRQFGLDRPIFYNDWHDLEADEVKRLIETAHGDVADVEVKAKKEARYLLEDLGQYAVPPLIELLQTTKGRTQDRVRYWLNRSAIRLRSGSTNDPETRRKYREWAKEEALLRSWSWKPGASPKERAEVVEKWVAWYGDNRGRWEVTGWAKVKASLLDTQFGTYWGRLIKGDLGESYVHRRSVTSLIGERLKYSLTLNLVAFVIAYLLAVPTGVLCAVKRGSGLDRGIAIILFMLYSLPSYFVGTLLIQWLATGETKFFPTGGFEAENAAEMNTFEHLKSVLWHITLPLVCLSYGGLAALSRYARAGMLDVIRSDYVRTARAKGVDEVTVILKHVVRNGILPIVTLLGTSLPVLIGGSVAIEYVFNINGMGLLTINSIFSKDYNVIMGVQIIVAILTMIGILISDIMYAVLDPRISLS